MTIPEALAAGAHGTEAVHLPFTPAQLVAARATRGEVLDTGLYPNRNAMHRNMGPPELFPCCGARGYFPTEDGERYCDCAAGAERRKTDG